MQQNGSKWFTIIGVLIIIVGSIILDTQLPEQTVLMYPELYSSLKSENKLSGKTYLIWL